MFKLIWKGPKSYSAMSMTDMSASMKCQEAGTKDKKAAGMNDY